MSEDGIDFRPLGEANLDLVSQWLESAHVKKWWNEPNIIDDIRDTLDDEAVEGFIIVHHGILIGYIQSWQPEYDEDDPEWTKDLSPETRGIDILIGEEAKTGTGIGTAVIRKFKNILFKAGAPRIVIDPDVLNKAAIRAYEKAGFKPYGKFQSENETFLLMESVLETP